MQENVLLTEVRCRFSDVQHGHLVWSLQVPFEWCVHSVYLELNSYTQEAYLIK